MAVDATLAARDQQPAGRSRPWMEVLTLAAAALGLAAIAAATRTIRVRRQVWH